MKRSLSALCVLILTLPALSAPPTITLPDKVTGEVGDFIKVPATTTGKTVKWVALDKGLKLFPIDLLKDTRTAVVSSASPGKYRLLAYTAAGDEPSDPQTVVVEVTKNGGDGPAPTPTPDSELTKALKAAYGKDADLERKWLSLLQALYEEWSSAVVDDAKSKSLKTWRDLLTALQASSASLGFTKTEIVNTRMAIASYLKGKFPTDNSKVLDADGKKMAASTFADLAKSLKEVAK